MATDRNTTRRAVLAGATALAAGAAVNVAAISTLKAGNDAELLALGAPALPDPIFALIVRHRAAHQAWVETVRKVDALEGVIPSHRCKSYHIDHRGTDIGKDDDPRWTAAQDAYWAAHDKLEETAIALLDTRPTTMAGLLALLQHAAKSADAVDATDFPDGLLKDEVDPEDARLGDCRNWTYFVLANSAAALENLIA